MAIDLLLLRLGLGSSTTFAPFYGVSRLSINLSISAAAPFRLVCLVYFVSVQTVGLKQERQQLKGIPGPTS